MLPTSAFAASILILLSISGIAHSTNSAGELFLSQNALKEGVSVLPSGLQYRVIIDGSGRESPFSNTSCLVHYVGTLIDGTEFDSSYRRGKVHAAFCYFHFARSFCPLQPSVVEPQSTAKGFHEALLLMTEGSRWQMCVLGSLARAAAESSYRVAQSSSQ